MHLGGGTFLPETRVTISRACLELRSFPQGIICTMAPHGEMHHPSPMDSVNQTAPESETANAFGMLFELGSGTILRR